MPWEKMGSRPQAPVTPSTEALAVYYHVVARGNQGQAIFQDDGDRRSFLETLRLGRNWR